MSRHSAEDYPDWKHRVEESVKSHLFWYSLTLSLYHIVLPFSKLRDAECVWIIFGLTIYRLKVKLLLLVNRAHCVKDHRKPADGLQEVCLRSSKRKTCWESEVMPWQKKKKKTANWIMIVSFQVFYETDPMSIKISQLHPAPGHLNNEIQPAAAHPLREKTRWLRVLLHLIALYDNESLHISFQLQEKRWLHVMKDTEKWSALWKTKWMIFKGTLHFVLVFFLSWVKICLFYNSHAVELFVAIQIWQVHF